VLTGAVRRSSKRSLIDRCAVTGPVPCSGARGAGTRYWRQSAPRFSAAEPPRTPNSAARPFASAEVTSYAIDFFNLINFFIGLS